MCSLIAVDLENKTPFPLVETDAICLDKDLTNFLSDESLTTEV